MEKAINKEVKCPTCGTLFVKLTELLNVHSLGLALYGTCPKCGACVPCAAIWKKNGKE